MVTQNFDNVIRIGGESMRLKDRKGQFFPCVECKRKYLEENMVIPKGTWNHGSPLHCIRCYNLRGKNEKEELQEEVNTKLERLIKESVARTTDHEGISLAQEMGKIESYFKQEI